MKKELIWYLPAATVTLGIFALSTFLTIPIQVEGVNQLDKWEHTFAYGVLSFSFLFGLLRTKKYTRRIGFQVFIACGLYGLMLEFFQYQFFTYRYFEWVDAMANVLGAVLGFALFGLICRRK